MPGFQERAWDFTAHLQQAETSESRIRQSIMFVIFMLNGDYLNQNAKVIWLCIMPQGDKFQGDEKDDTEYLAW